MADDHAIVRAGFRALLEQEHDLQILAECGSVAQAHEAVATHLPDVLALDVSIPGGGLNLASLMREQYPSVAVLILSMHEGDPYVSEALRRGVVGYVTKAAAPDELVAALHAVARGEPYLSSDIVRPAPPADLAQVSEREREVFLLLARGMTPKQLAAELGISVKTAYLHRASLRSKLDLRSDLDFHRLAVALGILPSG